MQTEREDFLQRAAECLRMAERLNGHHREELRQIAYEWMRLAEEVTAELESGAATGRPTQ